MSRVPTPNPILSRGDVMLALTEPVHFALVRTLPAPTTDRLAGHLARFALTLRPAKRERCARRYLAILGEHRARMPPPEQYLLELTTTELQLRAMYARLGVDPAWRPRLEVEGADLLAEAVGRGAGVVLWALPLAMCALLVWMACARQGLCLYGIASTWHAPSRSRFGRWLFNSRDCRVEEQFGAHLWLNYENTKPTLVAARRVLREGGLVAIYGVDQTNRPVYYPLFSGHMGLALGAPATARRSGAALFAAIVGRIEGGYRVEFRPMELGGNRPLEEVGAEFAALLEDAASQSPSLWRVDSNQWQPGRWEGEATAAAS